MEHRTIESSASGDFMTIGEYTIDHTNGHFSAIRVLKNGKKKFAGTWDFEEVPGIVRRIRKGSADTCSIAEFDITALENFLSTI